MRYFGAWEDPDAALNRWLDEKDDLLAGRTPRKRNPDALTIKALADRFLTEKHDAVEVGELHVRTFRDYRRVLQHVADTLGKDRLIEDLTADDFRLLRKSFSEKHGPTRLGKDVTVTRMLFRWGHESGLCGLPLFGPGFTSRRNAPSSREPPGSVDGKTSTARRSD